MYQREQYQTIINRLREPRKFIQVVMGPRQIGKTTVVKQVLNALEGEIPYLVFSADNIPAIQNSWISDCWATARAQMKLEGNKELILAIDEIQKLKAWSEVVKKEWDDDTFSNINLKVILQVFNSALRNVYSGYTFPEVMRDPKVWGHLFESAIGAHLVNGALTGNYEVYYWRDGDYEVDYILMKNNKVVAIEVKSNSDTVNKGLALFREQYKPHSSIVVGKGGMDAERFLGINPAKLFE